MNLSGLENMTDEQIYETMLRQMCHTTSAYVLLDAAYALKRGEIDSSLFSNITNECLSLSESADSLGVEQLRKLALEKIETFNKLLPHKNQISAELRRKMN